MPRIFIPPLLRQKVGGLESIEVPGGSVAEVVAAIDARLPGLGEALCEGDSLRAGLTVVVDGDVSPQGLLQKLEPESEVHFLPAIGGG